MYWYRNKAKFWLLLHSPNQTYWDFLLKYPTQSCSFNFPCLSIPYKKTHWGYCFKQIETFIFTCEFTLPLKDPPFPSMQLCFKYFIDYRTGLIWFNQYKLYLFGLQIFSILPHKMWSLFSSVLISEIDRNYILWPAQLKSFEIYNFLFFDLFRMMFNYISFQFLMDAITQLMIFLPFILDIHSSTLSS